MSSISSDHFDFTHFLASFWIFSIPCVFRLEHKYVSETGKLEEGKKFWLKVSSINPKMGLLTFSMASKSGGIHAQATSAPAS